jgi:glycosyltransferase involved in cell wall biosynthesis
MIRLNDLPPPPPGKDGFPWTAETDAPTEIAHLPKITVVTPSFNQGDFLEETIRAVLLQGYPHLEYFVMDGGSSDDSPAIIQKYADFLAGWVSEPDEGQASAINKGFARSTGAVMGWLNSDDILMPGALLTIGSAFAKHPRVKVVTSFRKLIDAEGRPIVNWTRGIPSAYQLRHRNIIAQETTYWRREVYQKLGPLDESYRFALDYEYWQRMLAAGYTFTLLPAFLGGFRQHEASKTSTLRQTYSAELSRVYQQYDIAKDEESALGKMGPFWALRYDLAKDLSHQRLFNDPRRARMILRLLHLPVVSWPILLAYKMCRRRS